MNKNEVQELILDLTGQQISIGSWLVFPENLDGMPILVFAKVSRVDEHLMVVEMYFKRGSSDAWVCGKDVEVCLKLHPGRWLIPFESLPSDLKSMISQPRKKVLTKIQSSIYAYLSDFMAVNGFPPTRAEISQRFGYSSNNAADQHLRAIARKGFIELLPTSRKVRLLGA